MSLVRLPASDKRHVRAAGGAAEPKRRTASFSAAALVSLLCFLMAIVLILIGAEWLKPPTVVVVVSDDHHDRPNAESPRDDQENLRLQFHATEYQEMMAECRRRNTTFPFRDGNLMRGLFQEEALTCVDASTGDLFADTPPAVDGGNDTWIFRASQWRIRRGTINISSLTALQAKHTSTVTLYPNTTAVFASTVANMYNVWNDVILPLQHSLLSLLHQGGGEGGGMQMIEPFLVAPAAVRRLGIKHVAVTEHSTSTLATRLVAISQLLGLTISGTHDYAATIIYDGGDVIRLHRTNEKDRQHEPIRCFCRSLWSGPMALLSMRRGDKFVRGDTARRAATFAVKKRMVKRLKLMPYDAFQSAVEAERANRWNMIANRVTWIVPATELNLFNIFSAVPEVRCHPRLVIIQRNSSRRIGNVKDIQSAASEAGFAVTTVDLQEYNLTVQAHTARYADVLVGVHGQGLTWVSMMDGISAPRCRYLVELRHYGRAFHGIHNVYEVLAADSYIRYLSMPPSAVSFDAAIVPPHRKARVMSRLMTATFPQGSPEFDAQMLFYDRAILLKAFRYMYRRVLACSCSASLSVDREEGEGSTLLEPWEEEWSTVMK